MGTKLKTGIIYALVIFFIIGVLGTAIGVSSGANVMIPIVAAALVLFVGSLITLAVVAEHEESLNKYFKKLWKHDTR
jgi:hypothetical protein